MKNHLDFKVPDPSTITFRVAGLQRGKDTQICESISNYIQTLFNKN